MRERLSEIRTERERDREREREREIGEKNGRERVCERVNIDIKFREE